MKLDGTHLTPEQIAANLVRIEQTEGNAAGHLCDQRHHLAAAINGEQEPGSSPATGPENK